MSFAGRPGPDLKAARWTLLAWEDPRDARWAELFRADIAMVEARAAQPGEHAWPRLLRRPGATFTGLRLLDGALVLKVWRGRETGQIRVIDGAAFDPALSGLEVAMREAWLRAAAGPASRASSGRSCAAEGRPVGDACPHAARAWIRPSTAFFSGPAGINSGGVRCAAAGACAREAGP